MPGTRGQRFSSRMSASVPAPIASATTFVLPREHPLDDSPCLAQRALRGTEKPKSFGTWLSSTVSAMPFM